MRIKLETATFADAPALASLAADVAKDLTLKFGKGPWSSSGTERGVLFHMRTSMVCVARNGKDIIATLTLATKKPWAIDKKYFALCKKPLYLTGMAVKPDMQRKGIGKLCIDEARRIAQEWPSDALRLDAFDAEAGAGAFYQKCGFREVGRGSYRNVPLIYFEMLL